jgi:hypothetical protein
MKNYLTLDDMYLARLQFQQGTDNPEVMDGITMQDVKEFADGDLVENDKPDLEKGEDLPTIFGFRQAAEKYESAGKFASAKLPLDGMKQIISKVATEGMKKGLPEQEIIKNIDYFMDQYGYTDRMMHPETYDLNELDDKFEYFTDRPNPLPGLKLLTSVSSSLGGTVAGAKLGANIGKFFGLPGAAVGAVLGGTTAYIASLAGYEGLMTHLNSKGVLYSPTFDEYGEMIGYETGINRPTQDQLVDYLKKEAQFDLMLGGGLTAVRPVMSLFKAGGQKLLSPNESIYNKLKAIGVDPGRAEVSNIPIINSLPNVLGRVPFFGPEFEKAYAKNVGGFIKAGEKKVPGFKQLVDAAKAGPVSPMAKMGYNVREAFLAGDKKMMDDILDKYRLRDESGRLLNKAFDIESLRTFSKEMADRLSAGTDFGKASGDLKMVSDLFKEIYEPKNADNVGRFVDFDRVKYIKDTISTTIGDLTERGVGRVGKSSVDDLMRAQDFLERILGNPVKPANVTDEAFDKLKKAYLDNLNTADKEYAQYAILMGDQKKNFKGAGSFYFEDKVLMGCSFLDDLFEKAFTLSTPQGVRTIHKIFKAADPKSLKAAGIQGTGEDAFKDALTYKLGRSFQEAFTTTSKGSAGLADDLGKMTFDVQKYKMSLGLDQFGKLDDGNLRGLSAALDLAKLKDAGGETLTVDTLKNFADASAIFFNNKNFNLSTFLARRAQIGGVRSFLRGITGAGLVGASTLTVGPIGTIAAVLLSKYSARLMAQPFVLRPMSEAMKDLSSGKYLKDPSSLVSLGRALERFFDNDQALENSLENDFTQLGMIESAENSYSQFGGLKDVAIKNNLDTSKFVETVKEKLLPDTKQDEVTRPNTVLSTSDAAQQPQTTVQVPNVEQVARPNIPSINEVINQPLAARAADPQAAEVLFPQDELLQASLRRNA